MSKHWEVFDLLFRFLTEDELNLHARVLTTNSFGRSFDHPTESNLWQLDINSQVDYIKSITKTGCVRGEPARESFAASIKWKFGERMAADYMRSCIIKIWSMNPDSLETAKAPKMRSNFNQLTK